MKLTHYHTYTLKIHKTLKNDPINENYTIFRKKIILIFEIYNKKITSDTSKRLKRASIPKIRRN